MKRMYYLFTIVGIFSFAVYIIFSNILTGEGRPVNNDIENINSEKYKIKGSDITVVEEDGMHNAVTPIIKEDNYIKNAVIFRGDLQISKDIELDIGDFLNAYNNTPLVIDGNIIIKLENNGWKNHELIAIDNGQYSIICNEKGEHNFNENKILDIAKNFINDSGIKEMLDNKGIDYEYAVKENDSLYTVFCYLLCNGDGTGSYIRMNFENERICSECQMNLYESKILDSLPVIPFQASLGNAFYIGDGETNVDSENYIVREVTMEYEKGIPYYSFKAIGTKTRSIRNGFSLAVDFSNSPNYDELMEKYCDFKR